MQVFFIGECKQVQYSNTLNALAISELMKNPYLSSPVRYNDVGTDRVVYVNGFRFPASVLLDWKKCLQSIRKSLYQPGLPRPGHEGVGFVRKCTHGAEVDDVARELGHEHFVDVSANL